MLDLTGLKFNYMQILLLTKIIGNVKKKYQFNTTTSGKKGGYSKGNGCFFVDSLDLYDVCNFILAYFVFSIFFNLNELIDIPFLF